MLASRALESNVQCELIHFNKELYNKLFEEIIGKYNEGLEQMAVAATAATLREDKLAFWFEKNYNVLFVGKHGVGKTSMVQSCFEKAGLILNETYLYFSAATLDPWVDFVGVPKEVKGEDGTSYLELVRPKVFTGDKIQAIFMDEYNRSTSKIRNAIMELIQFKSINGKKFPNLKVVWAAINPEEDDGGYDVEKIDPAQEDRFHVKVEVPYRPSQDWFTKKYGLSIAKAACGWWRALDADKQALVSPRRLDYALQMYRDGGDIKDILPLCVNPSALRKAIDNEPIEDTLKRYMRENNTNSAEVFLEDENNYSDAMSHILRDVDMMNFFLPLTGKEHLIALMANNKRVLKLVCDQINEHKRFDQVIDHIQTAGTNRDLQQAIRQELANKPKVKIKKVDATDAPDTDPVDLSDLKDLLKATKETKLGKDGKGGVKVI